MESAVAIPNGNTPVVDGQAGFVSIKQTFRNKEVHVFLNCAQNFYKCKLN